jgi:hypothetical protein
MEPSSEQQTTYDPKDGYEMPAQALFGKPEPARYETKDANSSQDAPEEAIQPVFGNAIGMEDYGVHSEPLLPHKVESRLTCLSVSL